MFPWFKKRPVTELELNNDLKELFELVERHRSEWENIVPCHIMKKSTRDQMFKKSKSITKEYGRKLSDDC